MQTYIYDLTAQINSVSMLVACFSACAYKRRDIRDWIPHISLFLSFSSTADAIQIPGCSPLEIVAQLTWWETKEPPIQEGNTLPAVVAAVCQLQIICTIIIIVNLFTYFHMFLALLWLTLNTRTEVKPPRGELLSGWSGPSSIWWDTYSCTGRFGAF